jgi:4-oxalomesaconate hydratase
MLEASARLMVFSAHAADFCSRSGGTILRYTGNGAAARIVCVTAGARGESPVAWRGKSGRTESDVQGIRESEARRAAALLGAEVECLGWSDNVLSIDEPRLMHLTELMRRFRPEIVLTHWHKDPCNPDHETLARAVIQACHYSELPGVLPHVEPLAAPPRLFFFEPTVPTTPMTGFAPDFFLDITSVFDAKIMALTALATQADLPDLYRLYGEYRGHQARVLAGLRGCRYAEAFARFYPAGGTTFN